MQNADTTMLELINHVLTKHPNLAPTVITLARRVLGLGEPDLRTIFTDIFLSKHWGADETISGPGSTLHYTENLRSQLPSLFRDFGVRRIFDAPCGDFNWMKEVLKNTDIEYIGADIVEQIILINQTHFASGNISFNKIDITLDKLPDADLMICRDCLFHLSNESIKLFIENFRKSNIRYLLTTSHRNNNSFINSDIVNGSFRLLDLFSLPFNFPMSPLRIIEDWVPPFPERDMYLFSREQLLSVDVMCVS